MALHIGEMSSSVTVGGPAQRAGEDIERLIAEVLARLRAGRDGPPLETPVVDRLTHT